MSGYDVVAIGASWGGLAALQVVLGALPAGFNAGVLVAQHRSARAEDTLLGTLLGGATALTVRDAEDKDEIRPGVVLLAPPDYHMLVEPGTVALSCDEPVAFSRPSIDVLFESAADAYRQHVVGVVLTGSNKDGARLVADGAAQGCLVKVDLRVGCCRVQKHADHHRINETASFHARSSRD